MGIVPNVGDSWRPRAVESSARLASASSGLVRAGTWIVRPAMSMLRPFTRSATALYSGNAFRTIWPLSVWTMGASPRRTATIRPWTAPIARSQMLANASLAYTSREIPVTT